MSKVLIVAFHFSPTANNSGFQRTLQFCRYLPEHHWQPIVLTAHPRVSVGPGPKPGVGPVLGDIVVRRAFALDAQVHMGIRGKYARLLATPDRWITWWLGGVFEGLCLIRQLKPDAILSTYPIPTAKLIALTLQRLTGLPWVADFRDPIIKADWPTGTLDRRVRAWIERKTLLRCSKAIFTTRRAVRECASRHPGVSPSRFETIANGYDEESFQGLETSKHKDRHPERPRVLVHSGHLYPNDRDPRPFFQALSELKHEGEVAASSLSIVLRASGMSDHYSRLVMDYGVEDVVRIEPGLPHREALKEMLSADGLLLLQGPTVNQQIPAKLYEYFRARRPILALVDKDGETHGALTEAGIDAIAQIDSVADIKAAVRRFLSSAPDPEIGLPDEDFIRSCSRRERTRQLADILDAVIRQDDEPSPRH